MAREASSRAETLRWRDGRLEMIDQRVLPGVFVYRDYDPAFDVTPAEPVTALITERGVVISPNESRIAALFES